MAKPDTIIYSNAIFNALCLHLNPAGGGVPPGAKAKAGGVSLTWIEETVAVGLEVPGLGLTLPEREMIRKVRAGDMADVAPVAYAHGADMASYKSIIFDLDFELNAPAVHRIVELNWGTSGDGSHRTPYTWSRLAAKSHVVLLVLSRPKRLPTDNPTDQRHVRADSPAGVRLVKTNYDLLDRLPLKFRSFDPEPETAGRVLAPDNYTLKLKKGEAASMERWIKQGTAFRFADYQDAPPALRQTSFCHVRSGADNFTIAGTFRLEKSLVGFLPAADLKTIPWVKTATEITDLLTKWNQSPERLSRMADSGLLEKVWLIVKPAASARSKHTIEVTLRIGSKDHEMTIPPRGKGTRGGSHFNREHLRVIEFGKAHGLVKLKEDIDFDRGEASRAMNALRAGAKAALEKAGHSVSLAETLFPTGYVGITNQIPSDQIVLQGEFSE